LLHKQSQVNRHNQLAHAYIALTPDVRVCVSPQVGVEHWPPYASSIVVELLDDGTARLLYQFQPLRIGDETGPVPVASLLKRLDGIAISEEQFEKASGGSSTAGAEGAVFRWSD